MNSNAKRLDGDKVEAASCRLGGMGMGKRQDAAFTLRRVGGLAALLFAALARLGEASEVELESGRLDVSGSLEAGRVVVGAAGTLAGDGLVRAPTEVAGTLAPDGILSFGSTVVFAGGVLRSHAADSTTLDRMAAAGQISGTATVLMTRAGTAFPTQQVVMAGATGSDYAGMTLLPVTYWSKGTNGTLNLWVTYSESTLVTLYDFGLRVENGQVSVCWETASEENTVGFDVYRWTDGAWAKVNGAFVHAQGADGMGASYCVVDAGANATDEFRYKLVETEAGGGTQEYGPFDVAAWGLRLDNVVTSAEGVTIRWLGRAQDTYEIWKSVDLMRGFERLASGIPGVEPVTSFTDENAAGNAFYRIRAERE